MLKIYFIIGIFLSFNSYAQMTETEISEMCMNQIVAGMVDEDVLGDTGGICVKLNRDEVGNVLGMDFKVKSSAFLLGKDGLNDELQKKRIQTIKDFALNYQKIATKNDALTIDDLDVQVRSYADGVPGPTGYDSEIGQMKKWSDLIPHLGDDKASLSYLSKIAPESKNLNADVNFDKLPTAAKSIVRNIILGKKRSETICKEFGIKDCDKKSNLGFASPQLEQRANKADRECADRRVSVIKVNLANNVEISNKVNGEFHPTFAIPSGEDANNLKVEMQLAASFEVVKRHNEIAEKYANKKELNALKSEMQKILKKSTNTNERNYATRTITAIDNFNTEDIGFLSLPEEAQKSNDAPQYLAMVQEFSLKHKQFLIDVKKSVPELLPFAEAGDFQAFQEKAKELTNQKQLAAVKRLTNILTNLKNPSTDFFNFYSTSQALQNHFIKNPNNSNMVNAATIVNQSNGELSIKLDSKDLSSLTAKNNDGRAHWQCYGGCNSGIHENQNGDFVTKFRDSRIKQKNATEMNTEFSNNPLSFGGLKSLNVYVVKNCANCDCLKDPSVPMESVLKGPNSQRISVDKVTKQADGTRSFSKSAGVIEDPYQTCIFTPPVAHTCRVKPSGENTGDPHTENVPSYACPMWDKTKSGLKWTTNFIKEGLGLAENAGQDLCDIKMKSLKEVAKTAFCEISDPPEVPQACK